MVGQIEWGMSRRGDSDGAGRIPALFVTLAAAVYKWGRLNRLIRRWVGLPEIVEGETPQGQNARFFRGGKRTPSYSSAVRIAQAGNDDPALMHGSRIQSWSRPFAKYRGRLLRNFRMGRRRYDAPTRPMMDDSFAED